MSIFTPWWDYDKIKSGGITPMQISKKCSIAIHCLVFINAYGRQKKVTSELLSLSTGCNPVTIRNILSSLKKAGIVAIPFGTGGATIEIPLEDISLYHVCQAVEPDAIHKLIGIHNSPSPLCPVGRNIGNVLGKTYQTIQNDLVDSLKSISLQNIVDEYHSAIAETK